MRTSFSHQSEAQPPKTCLTGRGEVAPIPHLGMLDSNRRERRANSSPEKSLMLAFSRLRPESSRGFTIKFFPLHTAVRVLHAQGGSCLHPGLDRIVRQSGRA